MFKQQKGITLIALVITIIVLLILAGITIAMLTGSDSAPAKANEAKQKQDIGAAKDQVYMVAQNAQMDYYEDTYVKKGATTASGSTLSSSKNDCGIYVADILGDTNNGEYKGTGKTVGGATITAEEITNDNTFSGKIRIVTRDFAVEGRVIKAGGKIVWSDYATSASATFTNADFVTE